MKELLESFKKYSTTLNELADPSQMKINVLMVIDRNLKRKKEDILSDIRAKTGVTIINIKQHKNTKLLDYNILEMKFDVDPFKSPDPDIKVDVVNALLRIRQELLKTQGIVKIEYVSKPERF